MSAVLAPRVTGRPLPLHVAVPGLAAWLLTVGAVAVGVAQGATFPSPFDDPATVAGYFRREHTAVLTTAVVTLASVIPLVLFASSLATLLTRITRGSRAPALVVTAGTAAGAFAALGAGGMWVLTRPEAQVDAATTRVLADLVFVAGGPLFAQMIGLVCLAVAVATWAGAVSIPRGMSLAGLVIGIAGLAGVLGLVWPAFLLLMPVARFGGLGWLIAACIVLDRRSTSTLVTGESL